MQHWNYSSCLENFMKTLAGLRNLTILNLIFQTESSERLQELIKLLSTALKEQTKLEEVSIGFPEPRYKTSCAKNHTNLDISTLICSLKGSSNSLKKLNITSVKGEFKEISDFFRFEKLMSVIITIDEKLEENSKFTKWFETIEESSLRELELNFKAYWTAEDLKALEKFNQLEYLKVYVLGELICKHVKTLRAMFVNYWSLEEIWVEFSDLDIREENRIEDMMHVLINKKRLKKINIKTKHLAYSFDRNLDSQYKEQASNEHKKMMRFVE